MSTAEPHRGIKRKPVKQEETQQKISGAATAGAVRTTTGAARAVAADELDPGRERRPLESYFQEIGGTRTLVIVLAKPLSSKPRRKWTRDLRTITSKSSGSRPRDSSADGSIIWDR